MDRVDLLSLRDDALAMLRRPSERLDGLAELTALADALGDPHLDLHVMLRRAAALRLADEEDRAAELARRVRDLAAERGTGRAELAACLELGQALLRLSTGRGVHAVRGEATVTARRRPTRGPSELAEELGDDRQPGRGHP